MDAKTALSNMWGKVWDAIHALAESLGITFNACQGLAMQVLNLLLLIPIDISFHTEIPLTIAYCPESSIYRKWHPKQGGVSSLCKEIRVSCTLSKVLGRVTHQPSESAGRPPSLAPSDHSADSGGSPGSKKEALRKRTTLRWVRVRSRPQAMNRRHPKVKISRSTHTPRTPSPVLVSSLMSIRTLTQSLTLGRKSRPHGKSSTRIAPRRTAPRKTPVGHCPQRKSCQLMRCFEMKLGKKHSCLTHALMLGITTKLPTMSWAG